MDFFVLIRAFEFNRRMISCSCLAHMVECEVLLFRGQLAVALGGRVAEEIIFGEEEVTTGASNDLQQVVHDLNDIASTSRMCCALAHTHECVRQYQVCGSPSGNMFQPGCLSRLSLSLTNRFPADHINTYRLLR
mmetsp:Transcript_23589/g.54616  ORF Transcript_23589/g.54616 Transcript_23589/m.54616 type:complete len:134 (+) Transcript_23589:2028-2429(+)